VSRIRVTSFLLFIHFRVTARTSAPY